MGWRPPPCLGSIPPGVVRTALISNLLLCCPPACPRCGGLHQGDLVNPGSPSRCRPPLELGKEEAAEDGKAEGMWWPLLLKVFVEGVTDAGVSSGFQLAPVSSLCGPLFPLAASPHDPQLSPPADTWLQAHGVGSSVLNSSSAPPSRSHLDAGCTRLLWLMAPSLVLQLLFPTFASLAPPIIV